MNNSIRDTIRNRLFYLFSLLISFIVNILDNGRHSMIVAKEVAVVLKFLDLFGCSLKKDTNYLEPAEIIVFHNRLNNTIIDERNRGPLRRLRETLTNIDLNLENI